MNEIYIFVWNFKIGGVQKMSILIANAMVEKGYNVTMVCNDPNGDFASLLVKKVRLIKLKMENTNNPIKLISQFKRFLNKIPKGAIIFAGGPNNFRQLARVNWVFNRWRIIFILHNDLPIRGNIKSYLGYKEIMALCKSKKIFIVALSNKQKKIHQESYKPTNLSVIPNFIDFKHDFLCKRSPKGQLKAVSIGRYEKEKGYDVLLEAMKLVDNIEVDVFGDGDIERLRLTNLAADEMIKNISFNPAITSVIETISKYDFFILPSRQETFGLVIIEALSTGLPVLATNCDGPKDIIEKGNGIIVEKKDAEALSEGIKTMVQRISDGDFEPNVIRQTASRFDIENILDKYLELVNPI